MFVFDSTSATLKGFSVDVQGGTQDPIEEVATVANGGNETSPAMGDQVVIVKTTAVAACALHIDTNLGKLGIATTGSTHGHNAGAKMVRAKSSTAPTARPSPRTTSSSGPTGVSPCRSQTSRRRMAWCVGCPSSACSSAPPRRPPTRLASAALVKSARPNFTNGQLLNILLSTAVDNEAPGIDVTSGHGILNAQAAMQKALTFPAQ